MTRMVLPAVAVMVALGCGGSVVEPADGGGPGAGGSAAAGGSTGGGGGGGTGGSAGSGGIGGSGRGGSGGTGGMAGTGGTGGSTTTDCPAAVPKPNTLCPKNNLTCTYGDDVLPNCRQRIDCMNGVWGSPSICTRPPGTCPGTPPPGKPGETQCSNQGLACGYSDGTICGCTNCPGPCMSGPPHWYCAPPPSTAGCPSLAPNAGTACASPGLSCDYGNCATMNTVHAVCENGTWDWKPVACPE